MSSENPVSLDMMTQAEPSMTQAEPGIAATQLDSPSPRASQGTTVPVLLAAVTTPGRINRKRAASHRQYVLGFAPRRPNHSARR